MADIVLATLNARHTHASLGLRYLHANLGALAPRARLLEFVIGAQSEAVAERILAERPRVLGLGIYIWNVTESERLVAILRRVAPELVVVLGGPEVGFPADAPALCGLADFVICGPGEIAFAQLCHDLLAAPSGARTSRASPAPPAPRVITAPWPDLAQIALPYSRYDDDDLAQRNVYVEASRGCPYRCEFCLSALDRTAVPFPLEPFLAELARLHERGARAFKFVDRTFNLRVATSQRILEFFLERIAHDPEEPLFLHFELVPDHLPQRLRELILRFPPGTLQFEIGIQTWNPEVAARIGRRQDNEVAEANLAWLRTASSAHLHVDLIAGLPGEDLAGFGAGFDRLRALDPHEIQVGILKRLRGAPIDRHTQHWGMRFNPNPPYDLLANELITFPDMRRLARFARYWDLIGNSGRFSAALPHLLGEAPFARFMAFTDWLFQSTGATQGLGPERLAEALRRWFGAAQPLALAALDTDLQHFHDVAAARRGQRKAARLRQARHRNTPAARDATN